MQRRHFNLQLHDYLDSIMPLNQSTTIIHLKTNKMMLKLSISYPAKTF